MITKSLGMSRYGTPSDRIDEGNIAA